MSKQLTERVLKIARLERVAEGHYRVAELSTVTPVDEMLEMAAGNVAWKQAQKLRDTPMRSY
jgi:hypothetical protein